VSRAREASRAAAVRPWTRSGRRPRRRAARAASRPGRPRRPRPRAWRGACARSAGAAPRATPSPPAPLARTVPPGTTAAVVLAAGVARPWSTRRPVSVRGPSPPYDAFEAAPTRCAAGPACRPRRAEGRPLAAARRGAQLNRVRPSRALGLRATAVRRGPEAALGRRDATRRGFTGRDGEGRGPPPARPVKSGSSIAPPPGAEGGALSCSSSASSSWSSRSSCSAGSSRARPRRARPERGHRTVPAGAVGRGRSRRLRRA